MVLLDSNYLGDYNTRVGECICICILALCLMLRACFLSTSIMVLQSSDCCWHHDYCVVFDLHVLRNEFEEKNECFAVFNDVLPGYMALVGFLRAMSSPLSGKIGAASYSKMSLCGCHYRILHGKGLLVTVMASG